eukprot:gene13744-18435_t
MSEFKEAVDDEVESNLKVGNDILVKLISQDNETFEVTHKVAKQSALIAEMLQSEEEDGIQDIPLPNVTGSILAKVVQYCDHYNAEPMKEFVKPLANADLTRLVQKFYTDFINVDNELLFHLTLAANYLDIKPLLDLCYAKIASFIKGKTPEQIRVNLGIVVDFTPEEEAKVREENKWADEMK